MLVVELVVEPFKPGRCLLRGRPPPTDNDDDNDDDDDDYDDDMRNCSICFRQIWLKLIRWEHVQHDVNRLYFLYPTPTHPHFYTLYQCVLLSLRSELHENFA